MPARPVKKVRSATLETNDLRKQRLLCSLWYTVFIILPSSWSAFKAVESLSYGHAGVSQPP